MATIVSAQSGLWNVGATWVGGTAPDLALDDVQILATHIITMAAAPALTQAVGLTIDVQFDGGLSINQNTFTSNGTILAAGTLEAGGGILAIAATGLVTVPSGGLFHATSAVDTEVVGCIEVESGGTLEVEAQAEVSLQGGDEVILHSGGELLVHDEATFHIDGGHFVQEAGAVIRVYDNSLFWVCTGSARLNDNVRVSSDSDFSGQGGPVVYFSRREHGVISDDDGHTVLDSTRRYGFAANAMRVG